MRDKQLVSKQERSRIDAAIKQINIVRRERGCSKNGNSLLDSALQSMSDGNIKEALIALKKFKHCLDLSNEHSALIDVACEYLRPKRYMHLDYRKLIAEVAFWIIGKAWQMLPTGNSINSFVVMIFQGGLLWICPEKQLRVLRNVLI